MSMGVGIGVSPVLGQSGSTDPIPDPARNLILDHDWFQVGSGTPTLLTPDGGHFVTSGANANLCKKVDAIPGATYTANFNAFKVGTNTPLARWSQVPALQSNYGAANVSNTTSQAKSFAGSVPSLLTSTYFGGGLGTNPTEIDMSAIDIRMTAPSVAVAGFGDSIGQGTFPLAPALFTPSKLVPYSSLGGQLENEIACRQGGVPLAITIPGDSIPSSGSVASVTLSCPSYPPPVGAPAFSIFRNATALSGSYTCRILGVDCTLTADASGVVTLSRDVAGSAVPCPAGTRVYLDISQNARTLTQWWSSGRNGLGLFTQAQLAAIDAAMVARLPHSRFLFGSILPSTADGNLSTALSIERLAKNAARQASYGSRFVDLLTPLQANGDGSANDNSDIANGWSPRSLRTTGGVTDPLHPNAAGYAICAQAFHDAHVANGYS